MIKNDSEYYEIEKVDHPQQSTGLPNSHKWTLYKIIDGVPHLVHGFRLKRDAVAYINKMEGDRNV